MFARSTPAEELSSEVLIGALHNAGSAMILIAYVALLALPPWALLRGTITQFEPVPWEAPRPSWFGLVIFGQMGVGALSGFEYVTILVACRMGSVSMERDGWGPHSAI